jgi:hypothetical protein
MAGRLILDACNPALTAGGAVDAGATLTFYRGDGVTLQNVYSDATLGAALSNPLACDSAGRFVPVWAPLGSSYVVTWTPSSDSPITFNDIVPFSGEFRKNVMDYIPHALWHGIAIGTDSTDLLSYIQSALINHATKSLWFPDGTFHINGTLDLGANGIDGGVTSQNRIIGESRNATSLIQQADNVPIVVLGGYNGTVSHMQLGYANTQSVSNSNAIGLAIHALGLGELCDLGVDGAYNGIMIPQVSVGGSGSNYITNYIMRNVAVTEFYNNGVDLQNYNAGGDCQLSNFFVISRDPDLAHPGQTIPRNVNFCYIFEGLEVMSDECNALDCSPVIALAHNDSYGVHRNFHFEQVTPQSTEFGVLVEVIGGFAQFYGPTIYTTQFLAGGTFFFVGTTANLTIVSTRSGSNNPAPSMTLYLALPAGSFSGGSINIRGVIQGTTAVGYTDGGYGAQLQYSPYG